jgi:hypothetical protein
MRMQFLESQCFQTPPTSSAPVYGGRLWNTGNLDSLGLRFSVLPDSQHTQPGSRTWSSNTMPGTDCKQSFFCDTQMIGIPLPSGSVRSSTTIPFFLRVLCCLNLSVGPYQTLFLSTSTWVCFQPRHRGRVCQYSLSHKCSWFSRLWCSLVLIGLSLKLVPCCTPLKQQEHLNVLLLPRLVFHS